MRGFEVTRSISTTWRAPEGPGAYEPAVQQKNVNGARDAVKTGDIVRLKVLAVDLARKRIPLPMKLQAKSTVKGERGSKHCRPAGRCEHAIPSHGGAQLQAQSGTAAGSAKLPAAQAAGGSDLKVAGLQLDRLAVWRAVGSAVPGVVVTLELLSGACPFLGHQRLQRG